MKYLRLTWFHLKRITYYNFGLFLMSFIMPLIVIVGVIFVTFSPTSLSTSDSLLILNESDFVTNTIFPRLSEEYQGRFTTDYEVAFEQLGQAEVSMVYAIPEEFPNQGSSISVHSINGENSDFAFETEFIALLSESMQETAFEEASLDIEMIDVASPRIMGPQDSMEGRLVLSIFMVVLFLTYTSGVIATDLSKLRNEGILTRSVVTNTLSWEILGSVLSAYAVYNLLMNSLIILILSLIFGITVTHIPLILTILLVFNIFTIGMTMFMFRVFKSEAIISSLGIIIMIFLIFLGVEIVDLGSFSFLAYLSPFYWLMNTFDTEIIFPNLAIVAIYGIVLFTAGSFKVERLVKK